VEVKAHPLPEDRQTAPQAGNSFETLAGIGRWWIVGLAALVGLLYAGVLKGLVLDWWQNPDNSHGFIVPLFVALIVWREWPRYGRVPLKPGNFGLLLMVGAVLLLIAGTLAAELFTTRVSLLILLAGMLQFLAGPAMLRALAFPVGYLAFMIPWPTIIYNQITLPLQSIASRFAASALELVGVPVFREGNVLNLPNYPLEVAEACSGIRSLLSLFALVVAYLYFAEDRWWVRIVLLALVVPVAVFSNGLRVVGAGILAYRFGPQAAEGFFHSLSGWLVFLVALGSMLLAGGDCSRVWFCSKRLRGKNRHYRACRCGICR
jgi:exosortase